MFDLEKIVRQLPSKPNGTAPDLAWVFCLPYADDHDCACVIGRDWYEMRDKCSCLCHKRFEELSKAIENKLLGRLKRAIENEGKEPGYHHETMERHKKEWPTLWKAIDELLR